VQDYTPVLLVREVGVVESISEGVVMVSGLPGAGYNELLKFPGELYGIAFNIDEHEIGVVLLGENDKLHVVMKWNAQGVYSMCL
jgi:F-type H+-transporting ATPase subunit alpha